MRVAIASGKGGTGKTTTATNLAETAARRGMAVHLLDCDVEEPNCHVFLNPAYEKEVAVCVPSPAVDESLCTACGSCGKICQFSAIVTIKTKPLSFPELCHGCGGCRRVCPSGAITKAERPVGLLRQGTVRSGAAGEFRFSSGLLHIGEARSTPVIKAVKETVGDEALVIIDAPPGTSCPVIEALRGADAVVLVTEPTPFGLHDFNLAVQMARKLQLPMAAVVNRANIGDRGVIRYCMKEGIPILAEIPDHRRVAEAYSRGETAVSTLPEMRETYALLLDKVLDLAGYSGGAAE